MARGRGRRGTMTASGKELRGSWRRGWSVVVACIVEGKGGLRHWDLGWHGGCEQEWF